MNDDELAQLLAEVDEINARLKEALAAFEGIDYDELTPVPELKAEKKKKRRRAGRETT